MQTQLTAQIISRSVCYQEDPAAIYNQLCAGRSATLLLESAEISNKTQLKGILVIDSALHITAHNRIVTIEALSANGAALLPLLDEKLPAAVSCQTEKNQRRLHLPPLSEQQDEDSRLRALSVFDVLRLLKTIVATPAGEADAIFLAGLFAYDLVATFEPLPELAADQSCPDFCFYLAETLLILDHQHQYARLQATLFTPLSRLSGTEKE